MTNVSTNSFVQGYNKVNVLACDNYGNIGYQEYPYYYDSVPPNIYFNSNPSGWTAGNPTFSFGATDNASGVAHIWYRISSDGSNWSGWTENSSCTIWDQGGYVLQIMACDNAGNYSYAYSNWVYIDHMAPTVSYNPSSTGWINHSINVTATPSDPWYSSGMQFTGYRLSNDGGNSWSGWTNVGGGSPFTVTLRNGDNLIDSNPYDNVGHVSDVLSGHYYIDTVAPEGTITPSTTDYTPSLNLQFKADDTVMYNNTGQIKCTDRDTLVPGTSYNYQPYWPTGSNFQGVTFRISGQIRKTASADDSKTTSVGFFYSPGNNVNNTSWIAAKTWTLSSLNSSWNSFSTTITIPTDCGASASDLIPWIQIGVPWGSAGYEVDLQNLKYEVVTASGVNHVVNPDGSTVAGSSSSYTVTKNGTYTFQAVDNAGNASSFSYNVTNIGFPAGSITVNVQRPNADYLTNTDVITSAIVKDINNIGITPDLNSTVQLTVKKSDGSVYTTQSKAMICPGNNSNLIWFRWHTPATADTLTITATINCAPALPSPSLTDTLNWNVKVPTENTPPATGISDKKPSWFSLQTPDSSGLPSSLSWSDYIYQGGAFVQRKYTAALSASLSTTPSKNASGSVRIETATDTDGVWQMKSGYPVNEQATSSVTLSSATGSAIDAQSSTPAQLAEGRYPEFNYWYGGYFRLFEPISNGSFQLKQNPYSQYNDRVHYTPVWYPDGPYTTLVTVSQAWTPAGAMGTDATDTLQISGALPHDWYVRILQ